MKNRQGFRKLTNAKMCNVGRFFIITLLQELSLNKGIQWGFYKYANSRVHKQIFDIYLVAKAVSYSYDYY